MIYCDWKSVQVFADAFNVCSERASEMTIDVRSMSRRTKRIRIAVECIESYYRREMFFAVLDEPTTILADPAWMSRSLQFPDITAPHNTFLGQFYGFVFLHHHN